MNAAIATTAPNALRVSSLLRRALLIDAIATAMVGIGMVAFSQQLAGLLHLPSALLLGAGVFMLGYAAVIGLIGRRATLPRWAVLLAIVGNFAWALACVALAFGGLLAPNTLGVAFLLVQAAIVVGFAELQFFGMKRSPLTA